jgi:hypothetical protein
MSTPPADNPLAGFFQPPDPNDPDGLAANRTGTLSSEQKKRATGRFVPTLFGGVVGAVFLIPFIACLGVTMVPSLLEEGELAPLLFVVPFLLVFVGVGLWSAGSFLRAAIALLDVYAGRVEPADGRLVWKGREYRAETDGRSLRLLPGLEVMPGGYRFYYLPRSGYVIGVERLFLGAVDVDPQSELRRALAAVFDFTDDDLLENQSGRLSSRQVTARWLSLARSALGWGAFLLIFVVGFGLIFPYVFIVQDLLVGEPVEAGAWVAGLFGVGISLILVVVVLGTLIAPARDVLRGEVALLDGEVVERVIVTGSGKNRRTNYYFDVGGQRFRVPAVAHQAMIQGHGQRYRLYYLPRSRQIVGVTPLAH